MIDRSTRILISVAIGTFLLAVGALIFLQVTYAGKPAVSIMYPDGSGEFGYGAFPALSRPDFFNQVKTKLVESGETFVEADLSTMTMRVYEKGKATLDVPIKTKGKEGSWWETPAGLYRIETKEQDHFSSFGKVHQPWSMSFQGNFFIHGWPYYPDGTEVSSTFSGGCMRLADNDAKAVYDRVSVGTPVLVFENDFASDGFIYEAIPPTLGATAYLIGDLNSNDILIQKGESQSIQIGSIVKLMTALTAGEYINMDGQVAVTSESIVPTKTPRLVLGNTFKAFHVLYLLLQEDSNEAAETFAAARGHNTFVAYMNKKALSLGMSGTHFTDPSGTEEGNTSTVPDLFALARYIYHNRSFAFDISAGRANSATYGESPFENVKNANVGVGESGFRGGISGVAQDGTEVGLTVFDIEHKGVTRPVVFIVLGSSDAGNDIGILRDYVARIYR